jgi:hypothetical protein
MLLLKHKFLIAWYNENTPDDGIMITETCWEYDDVF